MDALDRLAKLQNDAQSMSTDALQKAWSESYFNANVYQGAGPEGDSGGLGGLSDLAEMLASRPGDSLSEIGDREYDEDRAASRAAWRERQLIYEAELKRRGIQPSWSNDGATFAAGTAAASDGPSVDPHLDDGGRFGWNRPGAAPVDPHLDDTDRFEWKQSVPRAEARPKDGATPKAASGLPVPAPVLGIGGAIVLLLAALGFTLARSGGTGPAVTAPGANGTAAAALTSGATRTTSAAGIICAPAPSLALTLSGSVSAAVTQACLPTFLKPGARQSAATPYCRLQGIPNPPQTVDGVFAVAVAFVINGSRYELTMNYDANYKDPVNHGALPATIAVGPTSPLIGQAALYSWPATQEVPGTQETGWQQSTGSYTISADGTNGTIDLDFSSAKGPLHLKGAWTVADGCPPVGK